LTSSAYSTHPLRGALQELMQLQHDPSMLDPVVANDEQISFARDKVFAMGELVRSLLDSTPAVLASTHALNQLNKHVRGALGELQAYVSNKNPAHIVNAVAQFEQNILQFLWGFAPQIQSSASALPEIYEKVSRSASETIRQLVSERDQLTEKIRETTALSETLRTRLDSMTESASKERAEAAAEVAKLGQTFAEKEAERAALFEAAISKIKSDQSQLEEAAKRSSDLILAALEDQRSKAAQIVQVVGNIGVTGNYQLIANAEAKEANFWRWATVGFFAGGVTLAAATFYRFWGEPVTPESLWAIAIRLLYAIAITAPAWYTAKESARHRTNADRARQTELELASLGPFIELLPPEKKIEIREQMTKIYFGREVAPHESKNPMDVESVKELAIELAKAFKK
jgi:hypothetical protein